MIASTETDQPVDADSGHWRRPWSPGVQGHWLEAVFQIALSKPYIEGICWEDMIDHPAMGLPMAGLVDGDHQPKIALKRLVQFRRNLGLTGGIETRSPDDSAIGEPALS